MKVFFNKIKNFKFKWIIFLLIMFVPIFSLSAVFMKSSYNNFISLFSTYDNSLDMSLALGVAPDYDTMSSNGKINYASYLEPYVNNEITEFKDVRILDGQEVNRKQLSEYNIETIILNEWMKIDAHKFKDVVGNIAWTSMGDSDQANYNDDIITTEGGYIYNKQVSVPNAFLMQANDFDSIYKYNYFTNKANVIIDNQIKRIRTIQKNNGLVNKTLGFIGTSAQNQKDILTSKLIIRAPTVYPFLYSKKEGRGLGFNFPAPTNKEFENNTHYKAHDISAQNPSELLLEFKQKFDYLVIYKTDTSPLSYDEVINSDLVSLLKDSSTIKDNLKFGTDGEWYTPAWGIIGVRDLITKFVDWLKLNETSSSFKLWNPVSPKDLKKLRYNQIWN